MTDTYKRLTRHVPKKIYKTIGQVHGTGISANRKTAYRRAWFLMGLNSEAMHADVVLHTHYSNPVKDNGKIKVTYSGAAVKITNHELLEKLQRETDN